MEEASTVELLREALDEARELAKLEVAIARKEVETELAAAKRAGILLAIAIAMAVPFLSLLGVAIVIALGTTVPAALIVAGVFLVGSGFASWGAWSLIPKRPLERTVRHLKTDVRQLKEHIA